METLGWELCAKGTIKLFITTSEGSRMSIQQEDFLSTNQDANGNEGLMRLANIVSIMNM